MGGSLISAYLSINVWYTLTNSKYLWSNLTFQGGFKWWFFNDINIGVSRGYSTILISYLKKLILSWVNCI